MEIGLLLLRIVVGALFIGHGTQKLFGWFGGPGLGGTGHFFGSLGYPRPKTMARVAGTAEAGAGVLLVLGVLVPFAAATIIGVMLNAAMTVHRDAGLWTDQGGYEYPLVLGTIGLALAFTGPGAIGLGTAAGIAVTGWGGALIALVLGLGGGWLALNARSTEPEPAQEREHAESRSR